MTAALAAANPVLPALRRLEQRYGQELAAFDRAREDAALPLWMDRADIMAAKSMLQAKRDLCRDLLAELGAGSALALRSSP